ncbi:MAG: hypothetical protein Q7S40_04850 [Opitutaceae bacterium]|nr:hypothetical protein [Opitutaceae bacterium]
MKAFLVRLPIFLAVVLLVTGAAKRAKPPATNTESQSIELFENRKILIELPEGFMMNRGSDARGVPAVRVFDAKERVSLEITFLPDPEERFSDGFARKELMHQLFQEFLAGSEERAMQFEELEPKNGRGTYCVFTDRALAGKTSPPPNEYLNVTTGVKSWPGVVAVFTLFSNGTSSPEYRAAMTMLRESVHERVGPLR